MLWCVPGIQPDMIIQMVTEALCAGSHHLHFFFLNYDSTKSYFECLTASVYLWTSVRSLSAFSVDLFLSCHSLRAVTHKSSFFCWSVLCLPPPQKARQILICIKNAPHIIFSSCFQFFTAYNQKQKRNGRRINSLHLPLYGHHHHTKFWVHF